MGNYRDDQDYQYEDYDNGKSHKGHGNGGGGNGNPNTVRLRWYVWTTVGDPRIPSNYQGIDFRPLCNSGRILCAVRAIGVRDRAFEFSPELKALIAQGIASGSPQPYTDETPAVLMKP